MLLTRRKRKEQKEIEIYLNNTFTSSAKREILGNNIRQQTFIQGAHKLHG